MNEKILIDSGVLIQAYDHSDPQKQETALALLDRLVSARKGLLSTQILSEFFVAMTGAIADPLTVKQAEARIANLCRIWPVLRINEMIIAEAARGVGAYHLPYWEALLWASARLNQVGVIFSENLPHDLVIEGVRFFNPFPPAEGRG